jgi:hypothetical protein
MQETVENLKSPRQPSTQMRAVLTIFAADPSLMGIVSKHINRELESISWEPIFKFPWGSGHRAAIVFAYSLWTDQMRPRANPFDAAVTMDHALQIAILRAFAIRWGIHSSLETPAEKPYNQGGKL